MRVSLTLGHLGWSYCDAACDIGSGSDSGMEKESK
jgi:hypothetical protein